jgi:hypothetical protein
VSTLFVTSKKRSLLWRRIFRIELTVVFVGLAVYALLAFMQQVTAFCGGNFRDDATLLVLRIS